MRVTGGLTGRRDFTESRNISLYSCFLKTGEQSGRKSSGFCCTGLMVQRWIMEKYSLVKLRSYVVHLVIGAAVLIFGGSVLYSILSEMIQIYDPASKYAYICGIISCALILIIGLYFLVKAFNFENQLFKGVSLEERAEFFQELEEERTLFFDRYMFVTRHFILVYIKSWNPSVKLLRIDDLIACFGKPYYASSDELVQYDVILCDKRFHVYRCIVKGKAAGMMEEGWRAVCSMAPWVIHDDYEEFFSGITQRSKKKSYLKVVEHRKAVTEVSEDTIQDMVVSAADVIRSFNEKKQEAAADEAAQKPPAEEITQKLPKEEITQKLPWTKRRKKR